MSFLTSLTWDELSRLRRVVHAKVLINYPPHHRTDEEADRIIEANGPRIMEAEIKRQVDGKAIDAKSYA